MQIDCEFLSSELSEANQQLQLAVDSIDRNRPFFFVVRKGTFEPEALNKQKLSQKSKEDWKRVFLVIKIAKGSQEGVGRPHMKPHEVKLRLQNLLIPTSQGKEDRL